MAQLDKNATVKAFGVFVRQAREKQDLYQIDVATKVGITQSYYSNIESGKREICLTMALNVCDALGLDFNEFIRFITKKKPKLVQPTLETENSPPQ